MQYGEIRSSVLIGLPEKLSESITTFEIGQAIDSAMLMLASLLPADVVPELVEVMVADRGAAPGSITSVPVPAGFLDLHFVEFATERDDQDSPLRMDARIVSPSEYELQVSYSTSEKIASLRNGKLILWPPPAAAVNGAQQAIRLVFKRRPSPYMRAEASRPQTVICSLRQSVENGQLFKVANPVDGNLITLANLVGLTPGPYEGGSIFVGQRHTDGMVINLYRLSIAMAQDDGVISTNLYATPDSIVPTPVDDGSRYGRFDNCLLCPSQYFGPGATLADDRDSPEIDSRWHEVIVDFAAGKILINHDLVRLGQARRHMAQQTLAAEGIQTNLPQEQIRNEQGQYEGEAKA